MTENKKIKYYFTVMKATSLKARCWQDHVPLKGSKGNLMQASFLASTGCQQSQKFLGWWQPSCHLCLGHHVISFPLWPLSLVKMSFRCSEATLLLWPSMQLKNRNCRREREHSSLQSGYKKLNRKIQFQTAIWALAQVSLCDSIIMSGKARFRASLNSGSWSCPVWEKQWLARSTQARWFHSEKVSPFPLVASGQSPVP